MPFIRERETPDHPLGDPAVDIAFWVCVSGLILGFSSLFGIPRHGAKVILWKAMLGMFVSCLGGLFAFGAIFSRIARQ